MFLEKLVHFTRNKGDLTSLEYSFFKHDGGGDDDNDDDDDDDKLTSFRRIGEVGWNDYRAEKYWSKEEKKRNSRWTTIKKHPCKNVTALPSSRASGWRLRMHQQHRWTPAYRHVSMHPRPTTVSSVCESLFMSLILHARAFVAILVVYKSAR